MQLKKTETCRGFELIKFTDIYNIPCSLQKSSFAAEDAVWFGVDEPDPQILASKVKEGLTGWVKYPIHEDVFINTRMHLTREQVADLLPYLQRFVDTGGI